MCGRFSFIVPYSEVVKELGIKKVISPYSANYNAAPGQEVPVVHIASGVTVLDKFRWGLIPHWAKDEKIGMKMINARAESVAEKPAFRTPFAGRRCLVIADGFYEWKEEGSAKIPFYVKPRDDRFFTFAGLWDQWKPPSASGSAVSSCTIITVDASGAMSEIHGRMPAILGSKERPEWVDPENRDREALLSMLRPYESPLEAYEVSRFVNSPDNNSPMCIEPVGAKNSGLSRFF